jgi:hypothetical protein
MRRPFVKQVHDPRSSLPLRPALSLYEKHRFAEAIGYLEDLKKGRRVSDTIFYVMMTFATGGAALPFLPWAMSSTYDPLFRLLGNCYYQLGNDEGAVRCLKKVVDKTAWDWAILSLSAKSARSDWWAQTAKLQAIKADPEMRDWLPQAVPD